ncbi:MAG: hypothetical protein L0H59_11320 [Tomitella sp.]|nr:hypothetical protein [Tomitella sp.]
MSTINIIDDKHLVTAVLPWPAHGLGTPHLEGVAEAYRKTLAATPEWKLLDTAERVSRDDDIADWACRLGGLGDEQELTGEHVQDYLEDHLDDIIETAYVCGVADRHVGVICTASPDGVHDAAIVLAELLDDWPTYQPR